MSYTVTHVFVRHAVRGVSRRSHNKAPSRNRVQRGFSRTSASREGISASLVDLAPGSPLIGNVRTGELINERGLKSVTVADLK